MKMRKFLAITVVTLLSFSCAQRLQVREFSNMNADRVFSHATFQELNLGGYDNTPYEFVLNFNDNERTKIKAVVWSLINGSGEERATKTDVANAETGEWPSGFAFKWNTAGLPSDDYKLKVTIYDKYVKESDGSYSFIESDYNRVFVFSFYIGLPQGSDKVLMLSLDSTQDTGISDSDRVTQTKVALNLTGETNLPDTYFQKEGTQVIMTISRMDGEGFTPISSPNLIESAEGGDPESPEGDGDPATVNEEGGEEGVTKRTWEWTTPADKELPDGRYKVELKVEYKDDDDSPQTLTSSNPFFITIDNKAPEIYWRYLYEGDEVVPNTEKIEEDNENIYSAKWDFVKQYGQGQDSAQKTDVERLAYFNSKDNSEIYPLSGKSTSYESDNFTPTKEGFDPCCAGTQIIKVKVQDKAGNESTEITRKLTVEAPHTLSAKDKFDKNSYQSDSTHPMYNADFQQADGITADNQGSSSDASRPAGKFPGWFIDDLWYETESNERYVQNVHIKWPNLKNEEQALWWVELDGWKSLNFFYTIKENINGETKGLRFAKWNDDLHSSDWDFLTTKALRSTSGFVYKKVYFYKGVTYNISGTSRPDKGGSIVAKTTIAAVTEDSTLGDSLSGGSTGLYKLQDKEEASARAGYHYQPFPEVDRQLGNAKLQVKGERSAMVKVGFTKDPGYNGGGAVFDDLAITFEFLKTTDYNNQ